MNQSKKCIEEYLDKKAEEPLAMHKDKTKIDDTDVAQIIKTLLEKAFLDGYNKGIMDSVNQMRELSKIDPITFYNFIK